ncbi:MAG: hypothetical protein AAF108_09295 [Planctomycetota bacterium]
MHLPERPAWLKAAGYAGGLALLVAAIWMALAQDDGRVIEALAQTSPVLIAGQALLAIASAAAIAASFWVVSNAYGPVRLDEMFALVGMAWLLNYLPMRPGLLGRVAYHKKYNGIAVRDSVRVLAVNGVATLVCSIHAGLAAVVWFSNAGLAAFVLVAALPLIGAGTACVLLADRGPLAGVHAWRLLGSLVLHYVDIAVWAGRYALAAHVLDAQLTTAHAVVLAAISQFAFLVPIAGNGLGVREWSLGLAGLLGLAGAGASFADGVDLELINRAGELLAGLPVGLLGLWGVVRWKKHHEQRLQSRDRTDPADAQSVESKGPSHATAAHGGQDGQQDRAGPPEVPPDRPRQDPQGPAEVPDP